MAVIFIYGDASGDGYGISLWRKGDAWIGVEYGEWTREYSDKSSNHREMYNFTLFLEKLLTQGRVMPGTEILCSRTTKSLRALSSRERRRRRVCSIWSSTCAIWKWTGVCSCASSG